MEKFPPAARCKKKIAWQSVQHAIRIFTFTFTARTNLMFTRHPHLQEFCVCASMMLYYFHIAKVF